MGKLRNLYRRLKGLETWQLRLDTDDKIRALDKRIGVLEAGFGALGKTIGTVEAQINDRVVSLRQFYEAHQQATVKRVESLENEIRRVQEENRRSQEENKRNQEEIQQLYKSCMLLNLKVNADQFAQNLPADERGKRTEVQPGEGQPEKAASGTGQKNTDCNSSENTYDTIDYFDFEDHFRGSQEHIREVLEQYLPFFEGHENVADLGCGRGEMCQLLQEKEISYVGVDLYPQFASYCQMRGLNVICGDAIEYLRESKEKFGGIFAGQVVEHMETDQIVTLIRLAYEHLREGSYAIFETPNPTSLAIYTNAFYIDPSHVKPVHPLTMKYLLEKAGFREVQIRYTENSRQEGGIPQFLKGEISNYQDFNQAIDYLNRILFGSQDYAVIAKK